MKTTTSSTPSHGMGTRLNPPGMYGFVCSKPAPHKPHGVCDGAYWTTQEERPKRTAA